MVPQTIPRKMIVSSDVVLPIGYNEYFASLLVQGLR